SARRRRGPGSRLRVLAVAVRRRLLRHRPIGAPWQPAVHHHRRLLAVVPWYGVAVACVGVRPSLDGRRVHELGSDGAGVRGSRRPHVFGVGTTQARSLARAGARGAGRGRLARQFLTEGITLAVLGSVVAIPLVVVATTALRSVVSGVTAVIAFEPDLGLDLRVAGAMLLTAIAAGIVAGLAPALAAC